MCRCVTGGLATGCGDTHHCTCLIKTGPGIRAAESLKSPLMHLPPPVRRRLHAPSPVVDMGSMEKPGAEQTLLNRTMHKISRVLRA